MTIQFGFLPYSILGRAVFDPHAERGWSDWYRAAAEGAW